MALDFHYQQQMICWIQRDYYPPSFSIRRRLISGSDDQDQVSVTTMMMNDQEASSTSLLSHRMYWYMHCENLMLGVLHNARLKKEEEKKR